MVWLSDSTLFARERSLVWGRTEAPQHEFLRVGCGGGPGAAAVGVMMNRLAAYSSP